MQSVLLLQGPLGPFFQYFSRFLAKKGIKVHKIHFNAGEGCWPCAGSNVGYRGTLQDWPAFLADYVKRHGIDAVFCYSDCREYHCAARSLCLDQDIDFWVFEEGYLRPDYITLEKGGVNAHSPWYDNLAQMLPTVEKVDESDHFIISPTFRRRIYYAIRYYLSMQLGGRIYPHYRHHRHRPYWTEAIAWLKGWATKYRHKNIDLGLQQNLIDRHSGHLFLLPLQVADDFQIRTHSDFEDVAHSIRVILASFARHADAADVLVLKHHPMDRGYSDYQSLLCREAARLGVADRVFYGYELSLPELYHHCKGVVTVNSTVGISALIHHIPTITLGKALYDVPGLTSRNGLDAFWRAPAPVDKALFRQFRHFLLRYTQLNGSFYGEYDKTCQQIWQRMGELSHLYPQPVLPSEPGPAVCSRQIGLQPQP
ncbi:capsule biosynthesis protein [Zobellella endophytica]|uniref:Capsule biosynthesis protein n=1 Tax=Zobellella endophytica TaxID=2116700 RepID=A0A2P7RC22_9GAMM|nr:capsular biosynthesis protein [Zobellella endophytica]PSJ47788.1 capsule biosynthesis protein [Zobellella endophytica]